jgi:hypothetical protein
MSSNEIDANDIKNKNKNKKSGQPPKIFKTK